MKNHILTIILALLCMASAWAQNQRPITSEQETLTFEDESFTLMSAIPDESDWNNYIYMASDSITLLPGFERGSEYHHFPHNVPGPYIPHKYFFTDLVADQYGVFPPLEGTQGGPNEGDDGYVGALGGTIDVGTMGAATYTIPIELPAGVNGMQPNLAITYNSQSRNGLLGWCWDLAGLSSITRTGHTRYHDGHVGGITLNDRTEAFMLDGQRLIEIAHNSEYLEYRTEQDVMARIRAYYTGEGDKMVVNCFMVWYADGTIATYGIDDSRLEENNGGEKTLLWMVKKTEDRFGNQVVYHYNKKTSAGSCYIKSIEYTVNDKVGIKPEFIVEFEYERDFEHLLSGTNDVRFDYEFSYVAGNILKQDKLLKSISVKRQNGLVLAQYSFDYLNRQLYAKSYYRNNKNYTRLKEINVEKGGMKLNPTTIQWDFEENYEQLHNEWITHELDAEAFDKFIFVGDFNGDGHSDVITVPYKEKNTYFYPQEVEMCTYINDGAGNFRRSDDFTLKLAADLDWIHVVDLNDDGYDDLIVQYYNLTPGYVNHHSQIMVYMNGDGSFHKAWEESIHDDTQYHLLTGDFFGEGKQSAILFTYYYPHDNIPYMNPYYFIHYENGICHKEHITGYYYNEANEAIASDFDGDGQTEILFVGEEYAKTFSFQEQDGQYTLIPKFEYPNLKYVPELNLFPGDYNGDGMTDLLCYGKNNKDELGWFFMYSASNSFRTCNTSIFEGLGFAPSTKMYTHSLSKIDQYSPFSISSGDFDGDGKCDIALYKNHYQPWNAFLSVYCHFVDICYKQVDYYGNTYIYGGTNPLSVASMRAANANSQYLHVGNFFGKENMSFLGNEVREGNGNNSMIPTLFSIYSVYEYNSVTTITDGLGNKQTMAYKQLSEPDLRQEDLGNKISIMPTHVRTLKSISVKNAGGGESTVNYSFSKPLFHKDGHGYLGFLTTTETLNKNDSMVSKIETTFEIETMGAYAFNLPSQVKKTVAIGRREKTASIQEFEFRNVVRSNSSKVVNPAMMSKTTFNYDIDVDDVQDHLLSKEITEYTYSFRDGNSYGNCYKCEQTKTGIDATDTELDNCEYITTEEIEFYPEYNYDNWILNRPHKKILTKSRRGMPDVEHCWWYEFIPDSYTLSRVYDIPDREPCNDPFTLQIDFQYFVEGNLREKSTYTPYGNLGERPKKVEYEYGPNTEDRQQRRLLTMEKVSSTDDDGNPINCVTHYDYDDYDNLVTETGSNTLATTYYTDPLGITSKTTAPDGAASLTTLRWVQDDDPYAPADALYYSWSKSSNGTKTFTYYHKDGSELRTVSFDIENRPIFTDTKYNNHGLVETVSLPYLEGEDVQVTMYSYDELDRLLETKTPDGTITEITYNGLTTNTKVTPLEGEIQESTSVANVVGLTESNTDPTGATVTYSYFADGLLATATVANGITIKTEYDNARNRTSLSDPNYGVLSTVYDAYGQLRIRQSPNELAAQKKTIFKYAGLGRMIQRKDELEGTVTKYKFNNEEGTEKGTLQYVKHSTTEGQLIQKITYDYDDLARPVTTTEVRPNASYVTHTEYDPVSRVSRITYPTGVSIGYEYWNGYLRTVTDGNGQQLWKTTAVNSHGQLVDALIGTDITTHRSYTGDMHYLDSIVTSNNLQNLTYSYDKFGNLAARKDFRRGLEESFFYDNMNRLTDISLSTPASNAPIGSFIAYDELGRMFYKQADGQDVFMFASFDPVDKPHAIRQAEWGGEYLFGPAEEISYTSFDKVKTISHARKNLRYDYGFDQQRIRVEESDGDRSRTKDYVGLCEFIAETADGTTTEKSRTYLKGPFGVFAVVEKQADEESLHFILKDHLGSWTTITDAEGNLEQELSFDAWGSLRDPETWTGEATETPMFDRGFTGHEHLYNFGLINMNGRMYDPNMSCFLSVDAYVQDPTSAQGFNRYAYCNYNPLRYTDPTGWVPDGYSPHLNNNNSMRTGATTYHSDDPNDMLWGRTCHPCASGSKLYHTASHTLYYYTPYKDSIKIRSINSHKDLYRNLGFTK